MGRLLTILLLCQSSYAADMTLAWDASPDPGVAYRLLYYQASGGPTNAVEAGTNLTATVIAPAGVWSAVCVAFVPSDPSLISDPSNEVTWTNRPAGPTQLRITVQTSTNLTHWHDGPALLVPIAPDQGQSFYRSRLDFEFLNPQPSTINIP